MAGLFGGNFDDPKTQGLLQLGLAMMQGSGPSPVRRPLASIIGEAGQSGIGAYKAAQDRKRAEDEARMRKLLNDLQLRRLTAQIKGEEDESAFWKNLPSSQSVRIPGMGGPMSGDFGPGERPNAPVNVPLGVDDIARRALSSGIPGLAKMALPMLAKDETPISVPEGGKVFTRSGRLIADNPKADKNENTSGIKEYLFALQQGYKGSFTEWDAQRKRAGALNLNMGDKGLAEFYKQLPVIAEKIDKNGDTIIANQQTLQALHEGGRTGLIEPFFQTARKAIGELTGVQVGDTESTDRLAALLAERIFRTTGGKFGTGFSNEDRRFLTEARGGKTTDPNALERLIAIDTALTLRESMQNARRIEAAIANDENESRLRAIFGRDATQIPNISFMNNEAAASFHSIITGRPYGEVLAELNKMGPSRRILQSPMGGLGGANQPKVRTFNRQTGQFE